jgi:cyclic beta-1,2-glucan synthetase
MTAVPSKTLPVRELTREPARLFMDPFSDRPIRAELLGPDHLEALARELARVSADARPGRGRALLPRLSRDGKALRRAHRVIVEAYRRQEALSTDAEWLIDNFHIVAEALREVQDDLPLTYYQELPKLNEGPLAGLPRVDALALTLIAHTDSALDEAILIRFVCAFQTVAVLTTGEIWAVPIMLRAGLIGNLRRLAEQMVHTWRDRCEAADLVERLLSGREQAGDLEAILRRSPSDTFLVHLLALLRDHGAATNEWVEILNHHFAGMGMQPGELLRRENQRQAANQLSVGNAVTSLRLLSALDWRVFFEQVSLVEATLRDDPAGAYARQDFATCDRYRRVIEVLARGAAKPELEVARLCVRAAEAASTREGNRSVRSHVGYYLIGPGKRAFEQQLGFRAPPKQWLPRLLLAWPRTIYFGLLLIATAGFVTLAALAVGVSPWLIAVIILGLLPASELAVGLVHFLITQVLSPRVLPRFDLKDGVPVDCPTFVVIPSMLLLPDSAPRLLERLEIHYLANPDRNLYFALLTDFADAPQEQMPEDDAYLRSAIEGIRTLNERYASGGQDRFFLFHRRRLFNPGEGCWMGWERKRGKLEEFNRLLRGDNNTSFAVFAGERSELPIIRYVVTLDADTHLPRDAGRKLIATLAHPLNQAQFDSELGRVVEGYGVLQPRVSLRLASCTRSLFARIFSRSAGIDPYTTAVSDVYQDLFGIGSFTGKGIYDVDAFQAATGGRFDDNTILSHDLIEGNYARCGLVTDIELYDDFPARYHAYARREHRWVRGDWQLLPWLFSRDGGATVVERWKILDNLRRSLVSPALIVLLALGWIALPGSPWFWTCAALLVLGVPVIVQLLGSLVALVTSKPWLAPLYELRGELPYTAAQVVLSVILLAHQARLMVDAIGHTLYRLVVSRKHLLEWETAASTERRLGAGLADSWRMMWPVAALAVILAIVIAAVRPMAFPAAALFLFPWLLSPAIAFLVSQPLVAHARPLTPLERATLRRLARKTWGFFETFLGDEDHWLPPDNYQEDPKGVVAHRTSPTNIGMLLVSTLAAHDFGYLSLPKLLDRLDKTFATLEKLERHRGHFYNWYDTRTLQPLHPGYISTVDSGNLLACLLTLKNGLREKLEADEPSAVWREGLADTFAIVEELLAGAERPPEGQVERPGDAELRALNRIFAETPRTKEEWDAWLERLERHAVALLGAIERLAQAIHETPEDLETWVQRFLAEVRDRREELSHPTASEASSGGPLAQRAQRLADRAAALAAGMNFRFLYNEQLNLFSVGYNLALDRLDNAHYDLLASEASLTSFLAIARGDADRKHWFQLGRPLTRSAGHTVLISWGGTMFEYLMPRLLLSYYPNTLLDESCRGAVARQIEYGREMGVPWGISESGFAAVDGALDYQYKSFGVPGLGLKRGLARDLVIAPYATVLASMIDPREAVQNLQALQRESAAGPFGDFEAIDYTRDRTLKKRRSVLVKSFMAHHQGMSLIALADSLLGDPMPRRLRAEPMVRAVEVLLQERIPRVAPLLTPHPDEAMVARAPTAGTPQPMSRRLVSPHTPSPRTHLLSNGHYHVMVTNAGAGYSSFDGIDVTRWREDRTCDPWGQFIYIQDVHSGEAWSAGHQPLGRPADDYEVMYADDKADFRRRDGSLETHLEVTVSPESPAEVRRLTLRNHGSSARDLEVTSYAEMVLSPRAADAGHPAFDKLFLETEFIADHQALLCRRRPRSPEQEPVFAIHVLAVDDAVRGRLEYETDRLRFLGRGRTTANPQALDAGVQLSGTTGPVLDPIVSLRRRVRIHSGEVVTLSFTTAVARTRDEALVLAARFRDPRAATRTFELAWAHSQVEFRHLHLSGEQAHLFQRVAASILYANPALRAPSRVLAENRLGQVGLWRHGISGDLPIVLVRIQEVEGLPLVEQMLVAHSFWRKKGLAVDLVILNEHPAGYFEQLHEQLQTLIRASEAGSLADRPGGVFLLKAAPMEENDRILLQTAARVVLAADRGPLTAQVDRVERPRSHPPLLEPRRSRQRKQEPAADGFRGTAEDLLFFNGVGGFSADGREYVIFPRGQQITAMQTPAPWINVLANPNFGCLVSESGAGYTWSGNSQTNRLTPWKNDPVSDPVSEVVYLRDEARGDFWRMPGTGAECRHGQGYTTFTQHHDGIASDLLLFVPMDEPVKIVRLRVRNESSRRRELSAVFFAEWVLGTLRPANAQYVVTQIDEETGALVARNAFNPDFPTALAFADVNLRPRTLTADRTEFLGRNGGVAAPEALRRVELSGATGAGCDPCAALQGKFELEPGAEQEIIFLLGEAATIEEVRRLASRYRNSTEVNSALELVRRRWDEVLGAVQVKTPDRAIDLMLNRWLLYQVLTCRLWARSAFYQSGGAFGFRDQLQDVMALVYGAPHETRAQILRAASRQFLEGDVQHWWHPPSGKGVRTRISDDLLFLPFVVCHYVNTTGDRSILEEQVPFLEAPLLGPGQEESYGQPAVSSQVATVQEHCDRAIKHACRFGVHGLPLMGTGDWNDGMNRVGVHGKGESVWVGWFLIAVLRQCAETFGGDQQEYLELADRVRAAVEDHTWDGRWYRRAYFDDGTPLGSAQNDECKIDSIVQSWAVLSGVGDAERARQALAALDEFLVRRAERMILLFTPPFDRGRLQPGYIKGYLPGIRENGGQYTHASTWPVQAVALLGQGSRAVEYFDLLNPIRHADKPPAVERYRGEPYVIAADIYSEPPHVGRCGWTWYTGSAGWLYRVGVENILGFRRRGDRLVIDPCISKDWPGFEITYRYHSATYHITVSNPHGAERGVARIEVDGEVVRDAIELRDDGRIHEVRVEMA